MIAARSDGAVWTDSMTEKDLSQAIVDEARTLGWLVYRVWNSQHSPAGFPDLVLLHPKTGRRLVFELKTVKGKVSDAQREWLTAFSECGILSAVIRPCDRDFVREVLR